MGAKVHFFHLTANKNLVFLYEKTKGASEKRWFTRNPIILTVSSVFFRAKKN